MLNPYNKILDLFETKELAKKLSKKLRLGDVIMLQGELGVGKTTLSKFIINNLYLLDKIKQPVMVRSPTYPILLTYDLNSYTIYHYDLYRIKNIKELEQLDFYENIKNSITLIEWPEILIDLPFNRKYYLVNLYLQSEMKRVIKIKYFK